MTTTRPAPANPRILITGDRGCFTVEYRRPDVLSALGGRHPEQALALVSSLLPVCGNAQAIAAARAVEAALGRQVPEDEAVERERRLLREQALSAGWRLAVDWPDVLGVPRSMDWLKSLRASERPETLAGLLDEALPPQAALGSVAALEAWAMRDAGIAAAMTRRALASPVAGETGAGVANGERLRGEGLVAAARAALATGHSDEPPSADGRGVEVGPMAMARGPLVTELLAARGPTGVTRIMSLLLDMCWIAARLRHDAAVDAVEPLSWPESEYAGTGCAVTARGPVFHRVELAEDGSVARWRALAPTDWHFAPAGPLARRLRPGLSLEDVGLLVAGFDPCAPWDLRVEARG